MILFIQDVQQKAALTGSRLTVHGTQGGWEWGMTKNGHEQPFGNEKCSKILLWWQWHNSVNILKVIELYILNGQFLLQ